ncbi:high-affinity zinc uptake system binding-protein ZnuA [Demequina sediminis]|uniref:High-affinity zinc uptake system binding-protein ZnuA n=1 Tax=Demequina sediminis TaxID=1930058 RepID=A0ABP9WCQ4_9MICO|nr:metal ABC transporter substrate-binding protein [Demequina sediminis]BDZ60689.1 zinc ABC transporter substrate-binding protein [Demequina sediminis]
MTSTLRPSLLVAAAAATTLTLAACSAPAETGASASSAPADGLTVAAAFYPLEYVARGVAGADTTVVALAQPGVDAHDLELSPASVREMQGADLVLFLSDFQPAVDDAIDSTGVRSLDAAAVVELHDAEEHAEEEGEAHDAEDEHEHGTSDPHFWLDPTLLAAYADSVAAELSELDPDNADSYAANAASLTETLTGIDEAYATGLAQCERDTIFVAHEAFGYLTERYGIHQEGFAGLDPESEPSPARLLEIKERVADTGATVIFTEDTVSASVAESLANDAGVATAVLSPVETVADGEDYASTMTRNLEEIRGALGCA